MLSILSTLLSSLAVSSAMSLPQERATACAVKLAINPTCGAFGKGATFANANKGINLANIKNIVPFGDSWTAMNDSNGNYPPPPAVITGTNPMAGGRASNGPTWSEYIASDHGAQIHPYAVGGAVTNLTNWPTAVARNIPISDFIGQTNTFVGQKKTFDAASTLYTIFFGINDYTYSKTDGSDRLLIAAQTINTEALRLIKAGARNILAVGVYFSGTGVPQFEQAIFNNLQTYTAMGVNIAYVNFDSLWNSINSNFAAYGYTSTGTCLASDSTTVGACSSPNTFLYWQHAHPTTCTHRLMADYVEYVLQHC